MPIQPNILLITSDQQHYSALGITDPKLKTPNLDRLAKEGTRFTRAYCPNPTCSPTRASLITGVYPSVHGCWAIGVKTPEDIPFIGDILQDEGYSSVLVGKAHFQPLASQPGSESIECQPILRDLDFWRDFHGPWYGFNHVETARMHTNESHAGQHYAIWCEEKGLDNWGNYYEDWPKPPTPKYGEAYTNGVVPWDLPEEYHPTHWVGERTCANIEECAAEDKPFFLWSSFFDPHPPYVVPDPWVNMYDMEDMDIGHFTPGEFDDMPPQFAKTREEHPDFSMYHEDGGQALHGFHSHLHTEANLRYSKAAYYGMISLMDEEIGRILDKLDELGIADNTLVVFTTDHGHFLGQHGLIAKGAFHYEDMVRIPMIARYPDHIPANTVQEGLQSIIDLPATFLGTAGLEVPGFMQSKDQLATWEGKAPARDWVMVENRHNPTTVHLRTMVTERYKITVYRNASYGELFDLQEDPGELQNQWDNPDYAAVKANILLQFVQAEIEKEPTRMPRITHA